MGKKHYLYTNGLSGCIPETLELCWTVEDCVSVFENIFDDDLYSDLDLEEMIENNIIIADDVYHRLENFFTEDDWEFCELDEDEFFEREFDFMLEQGYVKRHVNDETLSASSAFGELWYDYRVNDFRNTGYIALGSGYGADYASWEPCTCDSPWEHTEYTMEGWIGEWGNEWFTEHFEVKIRYEGDTRPWEEIEAFEGAVSEDDENVLVDSIHKVFIDNDRRRVVEVRWNWTGSTQGHYFTPEYEDDHDADRLIERWKGMDQ